MPAVQRDRLVVGVPDGPPDVDPGVPTHRLPAPAARLRVAGEDRPVALLSHTARISGADVDRLTSGAVAGLGPVRLAAVAPPQAAAK